MRIEVIREKGDTLQDVMNAACACRQAFTCLVVVTLGEGFPRPAVNPAEIPFEKDCLKNQQVWRDGKPPVSRKLVRTCVVIAAGYALIGLAWYLKVRAR